MTLGVSDSCGIGVSSAMFLSVIWGVSGGLSGSNSVALEMCGGGGVVGVSTSG